MAAVKGGGFFLQATMLFLTAATSAFSQLLNWLQLLKSYLIFVDIVETRRLVLVALQWDKKNLIVLRDAIVPRDSY